MMLGTSPGYTGGCSGGTPDPRQYCADKKAYTCVRDVNISVIAGSLPEDQQRDQIAVCIEGVESTCSVAAWPAGCRPSTESTQRCIAALRDQNRINSRIATADLAECKADAVCGTGTLVSP